MEDLLQVHKNIIWRMGTMTASETFSQEIGQLRQFLSIIFFATMILSE